MLIKSLCCYFCGLTNVKTPIINEKILMPALAFIFVDYKAKRRNLKTEVTRKQSTPNFPKSEHSLPPDIHTCAHLRSEIRFFAFLPTFCSSISLAPPWIESPTPQMFLFCQPPILSPFVFFYVGQKSIKSIRKWDLLS